MNAALDFALLPPEINSAKMYSGVGSATLLVAASAWKSLAAELRSTASAYAAVLSALTDEEWHGAASAAMAAAVSPYLLWINTTAIHAEQTAEQAEAAASAYETAFAATVPPPQIAANRTQLANLLATNVIGQNTPAIAATEAQYCEMWAQDAAAMYGYAGSSAVATDLPQFDSPQQIVDIAAVSEQSAAVDRAATAAAGTGQSTLSKLTDTVPGSLQDLASPSSTTGAALNLGGWNPFAPGSATDTTGLNGMLNSMFGMDSAFGQFVNANIWNTVFGSGFYLPSNYLGTAADYLGLSQAGAGAAEAAVGAADLATPAVAEAAVGVADTSISAVVGNATRVGRLAVPSSWLGTPPSIPSSSLGATPMIAPPTAVAAGMPGVTSAGMPGQGYRRQAPQYGFKPTFVARPPAAG